MYKIYKITNTTNGLIYVGQTSRELSARLYGHSHDQWSALYEPIRTCGFENFEIELLGCAESKEDADILESSWICKYDSCSPEIGYNKICGTSPFLEKKKRSDGMGNYHVEPIRTQAEIEEMKQALFSLGGERDRFLFTFGINTGLRVSDMIPLRVGQVRAKTYADITERKTKKTRRIHLLALQPDIIEYTEGMADDDFLFPSRKHASHLSRTHVYRILTRAGEWLGRDDIGTHTMRKTFGYHYYKRTYDIATLMDIFGHSSPSITKRYIGIRDEEIADSLKTFRL